MITITALIIVTDRISYLKENINSLIKFNSNIFVISNGYNKEISDFLYTTKKTYSKLDFKIIQEQVNKCRARNIGVESVKSDVIYFTEGEKDADTFTATVEVTISRQFLGWIFAVGEGMRIIAPESIVDLMREEANALICRYQ